MLHRYVRSIVIAMTMLHGMNALSKQNTITAIVPANFNPYFYVSDNGTISGYGVDSLNDVASIAGLEVIYSVRSDWTAVNEAIMSGAGDVIPNSGISEKRRLNYNYTKSLVSFSMALFTRSSTDHPDKHFNKPGVSIGTGVGSVGLDIIESDEYLHVNVKTFMTVRSAIIALVAGDVEFILYPKDIIMHELELSGLMEEVSFYNGPIREVYRAIAVRKDKVELYNKLQAAVTEYKKTRQYTQTYLKWFGNSESHIPVNDAIAYGVILVISGIFFFILWRFFEVNKLNRVLSGHIASRRITEERLKTLIDTIPDIVWMKDLDGCYLTFNKRFESLCGLPESILKGKRSRDVVPIEIAEHFRAEDDKVLDTGEAITGEYTLTFKIDGHKERIELIRAPIKDEYGHVFGIVAIGRNVTDRVNSQREILRQAHYDSLTNLPNRTLCLMLIERSINNAEMAKLPSSLFFIDFDNFKSINDALGHEMGDKVLKTAGKRLNEMAKGNGTVGRLGGDEFIIIAHSPIDRASIADLANRILQGFRLPLDVKGEEVLVTISMGIALYPKDGKTATALLNKSDTAMHVAKESGKNNYRFFNSAMQLAYTRSIKIRSILRNALLCGEFRIVYQPKYDMVTDKIMGAEALMRWDSVELGNINPEEFIKIAEQSTDIHGLGVFLIDESFNTLNEIVTIYIHDFVMAINVSPRQLTSRKLFTELSGRLDDYNLDGASVEVEVTEGVIIREEDGVNIPLDRMRKLGLGVAMDDFGTGYSSLSYLRRFPFTVVKIDRSFIEHIDTNETDAKLVSITIQMAHSLNLKVVAEGIENEAHAMLLKSWGCDYAQGYYYSRPLEKDDFMDLISKQ